MARKKICGVYQIENIFTGEKYIGGSKDVMGRIQYHFSMLHSGFHSRRFQAIYEEWGRRSFKASVLVICEISEVNRYEAGLIKRMKPAYNVKDYVQPRKENGSGGRGKSLRTIEVMQ